MKEPRKLMLILAHPDDETLGAGGVIAHYAQAGVEVVLLCATRGERGWADKAIPYPGIQATGMHRERELRCACSALGVHELVLLDYIDGDVDQAPPEKMVEELVSHLRRVRPQVVVTFDPFGAYGHPDHIAISQFTLAAVTAAAAAGGKNSLPPHTVSKLYFMVDSQVTWDGYSEALGGDIRFPVDGVERSAVGWPEWAATTSIDTTPYWDQVIQAMICHHSQMPDVRPLASMRENYPPEVWGIRLFYRAYSLVNSGRIRETDLFQGLDQGF